MTCDSSRENHITINCEWLCHEKKNSICKLLHFYILPKLVCLYEDITTLQSNVSKPLLNKQELPDFRCIIYGPFYVFSVQKWLYEVFGVSYFPRTVNYQTESREEYDTCITLCGSIIYHIGDLPHVFTNVMLSLLCINNTLMHNVA